MKILHKGHEIQVTREKSMGGDMLLYYSIFRKSDGYEFTSGFEDSAETVRDMVGYMKERLDAEFKDGYDGTGAWPRKE